MSTKQKIFTVAGAAIMLAAAAFLVFTGPLKKSPDEKENTYALARTYAERGEYDRALSLLDSLLIKDADDATARALLDEILEKKRNSASSDGTESRQGGTQNGNDTSGLASAVEDSISSMKDALDMANRQTAENRKTMENLLRLQSEQQEREKMLKAQENASREEERRLQDEKKSLEAEKKLQEERRIQEEKRIQEQKEKAAAEAEKKAQEERKLQERRQKEAEQAEKKAREEKRLKEQEKKEAEAKAAETKRKISAAEDEIRLGREALERGDTDEAARHFKNASDTLPVADDRTASAAAQSRMAEALFAASEKAASDEDRKKLMSQAADMARLAVKSNPEDPAAHYILAKDAAERQDMSTALSEMQKAVKNDPSNFIYYYDLGKIQFSMKRYSDAAASFQASCDINPQYAQSRFNLGMTQKQLKNSSAALDAFRKTAEINQQHEKAYIEQGRILSAQGKFSEAEKAYGTAVSLNGPNRTQAAMELGSVYYQHGNPKQAEENYRIALTMLQDGTARTMTQYNLSTVLLDQSRIQEAEKYAAEAYKNRSSIKDSQNRANIIYNYALILDREGKAEDAIPLYTEVLGLNPDHIKTKINLGVMYMSLDPPETETALRLLTQAYAKEKDNFEVNNNLGSVYLAMEDYAKAVTHFQNALRKDPGNSEARMNLARAFTKQGDYDSARTAYAEAIKSDSKNWDAYIDIAKVCIQLGDTASAEKYLNSLRNSKPDYRKSETDELLAIVRK